MGITNMNKRVKIVLLGLMMWVIIFMIGAVGFLVFDTEGSDASGVLLISAIKELFLGIGLALALFLVYRDKGQNYKRTAWEAGIAWYVILLLMDLIVLIGLFGLGLELWSTSVFSYFMVAIITIVVGYLLAGSKEKV